MTGRRRFGQGVLLSLLSLAAGAGREGRIVRPAEAQSLTGVLAGRVTRGPGNPVTGGGGAAGTGGAAGVRVVVRHLDGRPVAVAPTDGHGEFRLTLPPGTYQVTLAGLGAVEFVKSLPLVATIRAGAETRLEIAVDTGVR